MNGVFWSEYIYIKEWNLGREYIIAKRTNVADFK